MTEEQKLWLQAIATDDLLDALCARFDHAIFAGMKVKSEDEHGDGELYEKKRTKGNTRVCQGLAFGIMLYKQGQYEENINPVDGDN